MSLTAFNQTVSILAYEKNGKRFAGTYAWFSQIGYHEVMGLLGSQSITGNNLEVGDICGLTVCSKEQKELSSFIGDTHSNEIDKFKNRDIIIDGNAIYFNGYKNIIKLKVKQILHLDGINEDNLIYFEVLDYKTSDLKDYLLMSDYE